MKKILLLLLFLLLPAQAFAKENVLLSVPFTSEVPNGAWTGPWKNGCEEASITMVEKFYLGITKLSKAGARGVMSKLFDWETKNFGFNADTDAEHTAKIINDYSSFDAATKRNPTLADIQAELDAGHPVISMHYGFGLNNPLIPFRRAGSSYHMMVIVGYDDARQEFIVNDVGNDKSGFNYHYKYSVILGSLHDFNYSDKKANGVPTVLFTSPKSIVKGEGSSRIYLIRENKKYYITNPGVFKNHRWTWALVKTVSKNYLAGLADGAPIGD